MPTKANAGSYRRRTGATRSITIPTEVSVPPLPEGRAWSPEAKDWWATIHGSAMAAEWTADEEERSIRARTIISARPDWKTEPGSKGRFSPSPQTRRRALLSNFPLTPRLPAVDIDRAREWYETKLGLVPDHMEEVGGGLWYQTGGGWFYLYPTPSAGTAQNTAAGWTVTDLEAVVEELRGRGVAFEDYDFGEMKTENGVLSVPGGYKAAWFKDSEGNTLELSETPSSGSRKSDLHSAQ
jgi:catechol 2,3-dioxygenase-like lactoylglutathione lyase family enzyme